MIIVADAGPLIALAKVNHLFILRDLFQEVVIPHAVKDELRLGENRPGSSRLTNAVNSGKWLRVETASADQGVGSFQLDVGETEAIHLAKRLDVPLLIDEARGRKVAMKNGVVIIGTGRILIAAKRQGLIGAVSGMLGELDRSGYRISKRLNKRIVELAGE